jgi:ABC-type glycerol-3-phosphate transport system permease component
MATAAPWMEKPSLLSQIVKAVILILITFVMLFPFVYVIAMSFSTQADVQRGGLVLFPQNPSLEAYRSIFRGGIVLRALGVSALVTVVGTLINMIMTVTLAYGLTRPGVPGARFVLWMVLFTLLFGAGLIPNYLLIQRLGLINSLWALMLPGAISAFNLVVIRNFFMGLPNELLESARLEGASDWQVLWNIILPLSKAVLAVIALFYGVGHWNDFFAATLYLNDPEKWPVQLVLRQYVLQGTSLITAANVNPNAPPPPAQTVQMAVVVIATAPILLVYPFIQKYFARGVLTGAIKG